MSYEDLKSQGSFGEVTRRDDPSSRELAKNARSEAIWEEQRAWVNQHLDVPEDWIPLFMLALGRARRGGVQNPSREQLVEWLRRNGWPVEELEA